MSSIAEKARLEAERAEAENPDDPETEPVASEDPDEGEDPETDPEHEQDPEPVDDKNVQAKFQRAVAAFVKKAAECFEVHPSEVVMAPHPGVVGIMLPGFVEPRTHSDFMRCETCNGRGTILTGAMTGDQNKDTHTCPDTRCKGNGYWQKHAAAAPPNTGPLAAPVAAPEPSGEWAEAPAWMGDPTLGPGQ